MKGEPPASGMADAAGGTDVELCEVLRRFYTKHHPNKLHDVPQIAARYGGDRVVELWAALGTKSSLEPHYAVQWLAGTLSPSSPIHIPHDNVAPRIAQALGSAASGGDIASLVKHHLEAGDIDVVRALVFRFGCPTAQLRPHLWLSLIDDGSGKPPADHEARRDAYKRLSAAISLEETAGEAERGEEQQLHAFSLRAVRAEVESDAHAAWADAPFEFFRSTQVLQVVIVLALVLAQRFAYHIRGACEMAFLLLYVLSIGQIERVPDVEADAYWCLSCMLQVFVGGHAVDASSIKRAREARVRQIGLLIWSYDHELAGFLSRRSLLELAALRLGAGLCVRSGFTLEACICLWDRFLADPMGFEFCNHVVLALLLQHRHELMQSPQGLLLDTLLSGGNRLPELILGLPRRASTGHEFEQLLRIASAVCAFERWCGKNSASPFPQRKASKDAAPVAPQRADAVPNAALDAFDAMLGSAQEHLSWVWERLRTSSAEPEDCMEVTAESQQQESPADAVLHNPVILFDVKLTALADQEPMLTQSLARCIKEHLPLRFRLAAGASAAPEWTLRYTPKAHGISMSTLYRNLMGLQGTILLLRDDEDYMFGGFAPNAWEPSGKFYGSGEAFVFTFGGTNNGTDLQVRTYPWTSRNTWCMYGDMEVLAMGGGEGQHAVALESDFLHGFSSPTPTFGNPVLASKEEFILRDVEIWSLEETS